MPKTSRLLIPAAATSAEPKSTHSEPFDAHIHILPVCPPTSPPALRRIWVFESIWILANRRVYPTRGPSPVGSRDPTQSPFFLSHIRIVLPAPPERRISGVVDGLYKQYISSVCPRSHLHKPYKLKLEQRDMGTGLPIQSIITYLLPIQKI